MILPSTFAKQQVNTAISDVISLMPRDVVRINYEVAQDWSGDWAIFFRVLLSDDAANQRLRAVTTQVRSALAQRLDFDSMGLFSYYNFRSVSEQAALREEAWA